MKNGKSRWLTFALMLTVTLSACTIGATPEPTQDVGAIQTQAYSIVQTQVAMQQTQTALAIPPTPIPTNTLAPLPSPTLGVLPTFAPAGGIGTPVPFNTQLPGITPLASLIPTLGVVSTITTKNGCNDAVFVGETAPMDKETIEAGKAIKKGFTLKNTGTCTWDEGFTFAYIASDSTPGLNGYDIVLKKDAPQEYTAPGNTQSFILKLTAPKTAGEYKGYWRMRDENGNYFGPFVYIWFFVK